LELKQLWSVIMRRWWLVIIPAAVALILAIPAFPAMIRPPISYTVTIRFTASQIPPANATQTFQDQSYIPWLASEYAVNNLATWMRTESFAREVATSLEAQGKSIDVNALRGAIVSDSARSIMTLFITWPDSEQIVQIARAAIDVLKQKNGTYFAQFGDKPAEIKVLDAINPVPAATPIMTRLQPLLRVLIGLAAGLALAFLAEYLDPTIRSRHDVEVLDLPVIAEIPRR
jgi:capsular polysaccharide biosynthesis protein